MTPKQIGIAIRKARGQRSLTEVAQQAGVTRHQVKAIEEASRAYTVLTLVDVCKAVGVKVALTK